MIENYEKKFWNILGDMFVGKEITRIEGKGGYINLIKVKKKYFKNWIEPNLLKEIDEKLAEIPSFREELYRKLYSFFNRYFNETGSIYFFYTPLYYKIYEKVYTGRDVTLFWKTHMLYYIKTDRIIRSMEIELEDARFFFDASEVEYKKGNEKRELRYEFSGVKGNTICLKVFYKEGNKKTKLEDILKAIKKAGLKIKEETLKKAISTFEKQSNVDYFINKDAEKFLKEQFDLWMYQYIFSQREDWLGKPGEIAKLQILKDIAYKIIEFISLFEEELKKIWLKPRFVFNSNYVITLDRIAEKEGGFEVIEKILNHKGIEEQVKEWKSLGFIDDSFNKNEILENNLMGRKLKEKYKHLPIDTRYFKELEPEILELFDDLDKELDGWLIKSENFQALNTILPKFREKVQTIYIDPPFNKEQEADYLYQVGYKDATWITMLENRLSLARELLNEKGSIFVRCDYNGNMYVRMLMDEIFGKENFRNEIVVGRVSKQDPKVKKFNTATDIVFLYGKDLENSFFRVLFKKLNQRKEERWHAMDSQGEGSPLYIFGCLLSPPPGRHWTYGQEKIKQMEKEGKIRLKCKKCGYIHTSGKWEGCPVCKNFYEVKIEYLLPPTEEKQIDSNWTDIPGYTSNWHFPTENSEILLKRVIESTSNEGDLILDFFLGSGTTTAVAHKLKRKWIGVEMGEHFYTIILPRMKKVLFYDKSGISKEKDVKEKYNPKSAGGFFKYYELEQYEDILQTIEYEDKDLSELYKALAEMDKDFNPYKASPFMVDKKLLKAIEVDEEKNEVRVNLKNLYPDKKIDLAETLSNLKGKFIKKITKNFVEFENGEKIDLKNPDYKLLKPLLWWE